MIHDMSTDEAKPVTFISFNPDTPQHDPIKEVEKEVYEFTVPWVESPVHELGFSPDGKYMLMMANGESASCSDSKTRFDLGLTVKVNGISNYDSSDPDPRKWFRRGLIKDPQWKGRFPSPFHMTWHPTDSNKVYMVVLNPYRKYSSFSPKSND